MDIAANGNSRNIDSETIRAIIDVRDIEGRFYFAFERKRLIVGEYDRTEAALRALRDALTSYGISSRITECAGRIDGVKIYGVRRGHYVGGYV